MDFCLEMMLDNDSYHTKRRRIKPYRGTRLLEKSANQLPKMILSEVRRLFSLSLTQNIQTQGMTASVFDSMRPVSQQDILKDNKQQEY